jgi:2-polyprenyl-6-methoxyphenol hydroxylase-like FAD-dependent oxidoreductase
MARAVVIGAGVGGLGAALALGRAGHDVTILERDATPLPHNPDEAFEWDRRGAPQVRHSHALLARLHNLLRDRHPDVLAALLDAGATELRFAEHLPPTLDDLSPKPGDEDLVALACRRTTFEWVLRRTVLAESHVQLRDGVVVEGLEATSHPSGRPLVTGVRLEGGEVVSGDLIVAANGRRSAVPAWLAAIGAGDVPEVEEDTGIVYYSRFYRLLPEVEEPVQEGPIGADLGYLKFAVFKGDNGTFSVTLAASNEDREMRLLGHEHAFETTAATLVPVAPWLAPGTSEPITGVHVMAKLLNRHRRFVVDGEPVALGFAAVGDASVCTNPLYGRGCSLAMVHAQLLADAVEACGDDPVALALAFDEATERELTPWHEASVRQDRMNRAPDSDEGTAMAKSILRDGVLAATRVDAVVFRAFLRSFNLLVAPDSLMADPDLMARVLAVYQARDQRPPDPPLGPDRDELLAVLGVAAKPQTPPRTAKPAPASSWTFAARWSGSMGLMRYSSAPSSHPRTRSRSSTLHVRMTTRVAGAIPRSRIAWRTP